MFYKNVIEKVKSKKKVFFYCVISILTCSILMFGPLFKLLLPPFKMRMLFSKY